MKKYLLLLLLLIPFNVFAISIYIDEDGNVSRSTENFGSNGDLTDEEVYSTFDFDGDTLTLKETGIQYLVECHKNINITSTADVEIGMFYAYGDVNIESDYKVFFGSYDKNKTSTLTVTNTTFSSSSLFDYKEVIFTNCTTPTDSGIGYIDSLGCYITITDSTLNIGSLGKFRSLTVKDSNIKFSNSIGQSANEGVKLSVENSTFEAENLLLYYNNPEIEILSFKDSTVKFGVLQGNYNSGPDAINLVDFNNCNVTIREIRYATTTFTDCYANIGGAIANVDMTDCTVELIGTVGYKKFSLVNCEVTGGGMYGNHNSDDYLHIIDSTVEVQGVVECEYGIETIITNSSIKSSEVNVDTYIITNSTIDTNKMYSPSSRDSEIHNSTINTNTYEVHGSTYLLEDSIINAPSLFRARAISTVRNSKINCGAFETAGTYMGIYGSKISAHISSVLFIEDFKHSYFLTELSESATMDTVEVRLLNYNEQLSFDVTDLDNNLLEPTSSGLNTYCSNDKCYNSTYLDYPTVLIRDKINVSLKVVNGTWKDGSTDDISYELYSFDKLSNEQIPTDMVPNTGYEEGSWDTDLIYDELNDDYVFTYTFNKKEEKGIVKGVIEEITSNPKTGVFSHTFLIIGLLICSIYLYKRVRKLTYYK